MDIEKGLARLIYIKVFFLNNNLISSYLRLQKKELPVSKLLYIVLGQVKRSEAKGL